MKAMSPTRGSENIEVARITELVETSEWFEWMREELPKGGINLPGEETATLFVVNSVRYAERVREVYKHLPSNFYNLFIEAGIIHQCWNKHRTEYKHLSQNPDHQFKFTGIRALRCLRSFNDHSHVMDGSDGNRYIVKFPKSDSETLLATEALCTEIARMMGLPTPRLNLVAVDRELARDLGISTRGWPRYMLRGDSYQCLGRLVESEVTDQPSRKMMNKASKLLIGGLIFDILTANGTERMPAYRMTESGTEPFFLCDKSLMCGNWQAFIHPRSEDKIGNVTSAVDVRSVDQLDVWIKRAQGIDFNEVWKLAFEIPSEWYGGHRMLLTNVLCRLRENAIVLKESVNSLIHLGHFPYLKRDPEMASNRSSLRLTA